MRSRLRTIAVIAAREFVTRERSKAFRVSTALLLLGMILGIVLPTYLNRNSSHFTVALVAASTGLPSAISAQAASAGITVISRTAPSRAVAAKRVEVGTATAAVVGTREVIWKSTQDSRLAQVLTATLTRTAIGQRASALGLAPAQLGRLFAPTKPKVTLLHPQPNRGPQTITALIGIILLFTALNFYGAYVLTGVVEEKSSRIIEVLLARTRPAGLLQHPVRHARRARLPHSGRPSRHRATHRLHAADLLRRVREPDQPPRLVGHRRVAVPAHRPDLHAPAHRADRCSRLADRRSGGPHDHRDTRADPSRRPRLPQRGDR